MSKSKSKYKRFRVHWNVLTESGEFPRDMVISYAKDAKDAKNQLRQLIQPGTDYTIIKTEVL